MLYLVRHGETEPNVRRVLLGRADPPLSGTGRTQAAALAARLPAGARVVSSPLRRAWETAEALGRPVEVDERWVELDYGELDGTPVTDVDPDWWQRWQRDVSLALPGGESLVDLGRRVRAACDGLVDEATEHDVVVVTHVSPIKAAIAWALGVGDDVAWRMFVEVASVARIRVVPDDRTLLSLNERAC